MIYFSLDIQTLQAPGDVLVSLTRQYRWLRSGLRIVCSWCVIPPCCRAIDIFSSCFISCVAVLVSLGLDLIFGALDVSLAASPHLFDSLRAAGNNRKASPEFIHNFLFIRLVPFTLIHLRTHAPTHPSVLSSDNSISLAIDSCVYVHDYHNDLCAFWLSSCRGIHNRFCILSAKTVARIKQCMSLCLLYRVGNRTVLENQRARHLPTVKIMTPLRSLSSAQLRG